MRTLFLVGCFTACGGPKSSDPSTSDSSPPPTVPVTPTAETGEEPQEPPDSACGEVTRHDVTIVGRVRRATGQPAEKADVRLEERNYFPTTQVMGTAITDATGTFQLDIVDLVAVEDCWGTLVDYVIVAELGKEAGEDGINPALSTAVGDKSYSVDITSIPIDMEFVK